jgi:predicted flavoprotein YhiN
LSTHLKSRLGITGTKAALLHECLSKAQMQDGPTLAHMLKALPLRLAKPRPIDEAISTAGGVPFESLDEHLMARAMPGVFVAGEMLDWEAPTGGYLLTATMATGRWAALGLLHWLGSERG